MKNSRDSVEPRQPPVLPITVRTLYAMAELYCPPPPGHLRQTQPSPLLLVSKLGLVVCWLSSLATQAEIVLSFPVEAYAVAAHGCCGFGPEGQTIGTIVGSTMLEIVVRQRSALDAQNSGRHVECHNISTWNYFLRLSSLPASCRVSEKSEMEPRSSASAASATPPVLLLSSVLGDYDCGSPHKKQRR